jgi:hypothetical protein
MLVKWLIRVSNYLHDWGSLPSDEGICISSLTGLWLSRLRQEAKWSLTTDHRSFHSSGVAIHHVFVTAQIQSFYGDRLHD